MSKYEQFSILAAVAAALWSPIDAEAGLQGTAVSPSKGTMESPEGMEPAPVNQDSSQGHKWGVEGDLVVPFVPTAEIFTIRWTRNLWGDKGEARGERVLGVFLRPNVEHDIVEEIDEYLVTVAYRQYVTSAIHLEAQLDMGYAWGTKNKVDGRDHNNPSALGEAHAEYTWNFLEGRTRSFYISPQLGVIHGLRTDIGSRDGKPDTFVSGRPNLGASF